MNNGTTIGTTAGSGLEAKLEIKQAVARGAAVQVQFTLTNHADEALRVLDWYTPLEGFAGDIFDVERDGERVPYRGILAKRSVPGPDEYVTLEPGESVSAEVNLAEGYDLGTPGDYAVQYRSPEISQVVSKSAPTPKGPQFLGPVEIPSNKVSVQIVDTGEPEPLAPPPTPRGAEPKEEGPKTITYDNCDATQENTVKDADASALSKAASVYAYLNGLSADEQETDGLYKTWYGAHTDARFGKVLNNWKEIKEGFQKSIVYNCSGPACKPNWFAYVYAGGKLEVFLCQQYWGASPTGIDTQYGILIHEVSHETVFTKDHGYGIKTCKDLAIENPDLAIENADNYEYFAEHADVPIVDPGEPPGPDPVGPKSLWPTLLLAGGGLVAAIISRARKWRS
jgi:peptidyl-Lys metalloendopeptidase